MVEQSCHDIKEEDLARVGFIVILNCFFVDSIIHFDLGKLLVLEVSNSDKVACYLSYPVQVDTAFNIDILNLASFTVALEVKLPILPWDVLAFKAEFIRFRFRVVLWVIVKALFAIMVAFIKSFADFIIQLVVVH